MSNDDFAKMMTRLQQQPKWPEAYGQILAKIKSNDPRLNALLDQFMQITPETPSERRLIGYMLFATMRIMALDHLGLLNNYTVRDAIGLCNENPPEAE